jgi:hypothetical protein
MRKQLVGIDNGFNSIPALISKALSADLRMKNPSFPGAQEVITQPVYDSVSFAAAAAMAKTTLFQTPIGQAGKTLAQTNMTQAGTLPAPQRLTVRSIQLGFANNTVITDVVNILENVSLTFIVGKKPMLEVPCHYLTAGCGGIVTAAAQVGTAPAGSAPLFSTSNGVPDQANRFWLSVPFTIEQGETFQVVLVPETGFNFAAAGANPAGVGTTIRVAFSGELYRQVQ